MHKKAWNVGKTMALLIAGNTIYALGVVLFILPSGLITGGSTGLALLANRWLGVPVTVFVSVFNLAMFLLGWAVLGRGFALNTLVSTICYPLILGILQGMPFLPEQLTDDLLLCAVYGGLLIGVAIGLVIKAGGSTGGMDIPPLICNKLWGLPVSVLLYLFDCAILIGQIFFSNRQQVLYGILLVCIYSLVLDKVILTGRAKIQVKIISEQHQKIRQLIIEKLDRGCTLLQAQTGYQKTDLPVILTVVSNRELPRLNQQLLAIDPQAFIVISSVNEVKGRGFSLQKLYR